MIDPKDATYALECLAHRQRSFAVYNNYYKGDQPLYFSTDAFRSAFGDLFKRLSYNRCRAVVDAYASRLQVTGWESPSTKDKQTEEDALGKAAMEIWDRNHFAKRQGELFREAMRAGDAYVIVWPGEDSLARLDINRGHLIHPVYDDEYPEKLSYAVKCWQPHHGDYAGRWRVNVYDAEVITRWISSSKSDEQPKDFKSFVPFEDDMPAEIPNPYEQVPVFHFGNSADTGACGTSELVDVIPLQDGLNKSIADMLIAGEYVAFPQRWVTGVAPTVDPFTNQEVEQFKAAMDRVWGVMEPDARFGQFDPADMKQYTESQDAWDLKISRVSQVPVHWLSMSGDFPSGESLKTAEGPFVGKGEGKQASFGGDLAATLAFALKVEGVADAMVTPIWKPFESRSDLEALQQAAMKKALSIPEEQIWAELGYSRDEIEEFTAAAEKKRKEQMDQFATAFDRGTVPIGG